MKKIEKLYPSSQVDKAGEILRKSHMSDEETDFSEKVIDNWRSIHTYALNTFQATLRSKLDKVDKQGLVAQRLKRTPSIKRKLMALKTMNLSQMQDIGGLRAIVTNVKSVYSVYESYKNPQRKGNFLHQLVNEKDYIKNPKQSGYRGVHLIYKYINKRAPEYNGLHLEIQLRSKIQHSWATSVEVMEIFLNQALKASEGESKWLEFFAFAASAFSLLEDCPVIERHENLDPNAIFQEVKSRATELGVENKLESYSKAVEQLPATGKGKYFLIQLNIDERTMGFNAFSEGELEEANAKYIEAERSIQGGTKQVVLVSTTSIESLKKAYPNYFLDTKDFVANLRKVYKKTPN